MLKKLRSETPGVDIVKFLSPKKYKIPPNVDPFINWVNPIRPKNNTE